MIIISNISIASFGAFANTIGLYGERRIKVFLHLFDY